MTARQISTANRAENGDARHGGRSDTDRALTQSRPIAVLVDREGLGDALLKLPLLRAIAKGPAHLVTGSPETALVPEHTAAELTNGA